MSPARPAVGNDTAREPIAGPAGLSLPMGPRPPHLLPACLLAVLLSACGSGEATPVDDDAGAEAGDDAGLDGASDVGGGADAGADAATDAPVDATPEVAPPAGTVPAFVAQGHAGRTTVSCDDGRTWVGDRSDAPTLRCFEGGNDCDHDPGAGRGLGYGGGHFVATFGWGKPGSIRRSKDGITWTKVLDGTTFGGMVYDGGFLAAARTGRASKDFGVNWASVTEVPTDQWNVRHAAFVEGVGVVVVLEDGRPDLAITSDLGKTWRKPTSLPAGCGKGVQGVAGNGKAFVVVGSDGTACTSTDQGKTFTSSAMGGTVDGAPISTGSRFYAFGADASYARVRFESVDGKAWTKAKTSVRSVGGNGPELGPVARSPVTGTFVAVRGGWMQWYEKQVFYRSEDGLVWDALPAGSFVPSHPIRGITFGHVDKSALCK